MEERTYLIPANTKKGRLIFNLFMPIDLGILCVGVFISFMLISILGADNLAQSIIVMLPGMTAGFLVLPVPNYHNVLTVIRGAIEFFTERMTFIWKGWCFNDIERETEK
jgi:hypothetical protein